jgi:hypothetical protein
MGWAREFSQASLPWQRHCSALSIWTEATCGFLGKGARKLGGLHYSSMGAMHIVAAGTEQP